MNTAHHAAEPASEDPRELRIEDALDGGRWLARLPDGMAVFLRGDGVPGETVQVAVDRRRKRYAEGRILEVLDPSPDRQAPPCPWFGRCGGCSWQHVNPDAERRVKVRHLADALQRIGHQQEFTMEPMRCSPAAYGTRNRIELSVGADRKGRLKLGMHGTSPGSPLESVDACLLAATGIEQGYLELAGALRRAGIRAWDTRRGTGLLRSVILRIAPATGDRMIVFVTGRNGEAARLRAAVKSWDDSTHPAWSVVQSIVPGKHDHGPAVEVKALVGHDYLEDQLGPFRIRVPADAFLQVHAGLHAALYEEVLALLDPHPGMRVWEAYSGIGTLSLYLGRQGVDLQAWEGQARSVAAAGWNAEANGVGGIRFGAMDLNHPEPLPVPVPEAVVVDPPRAGLSPALMEQLAGSGVPRLVYVSCNPASLARDVAVLCDGGYRLAVVRPVEMFPRTGHLEAVARLEWTGS